MYSMCEKTVKLKLRIYIKSLEVNTIARFRTNRRKQKVDS